jgi:hypothetical protein
LEAGPLDFEQIRNDFVVNLKVTSANHKCYVVIGLHLDEVEYLLHASWYYAPMRISAVVFKSLHSVGFTSASLAISKNSGIVSFKDTVNCGFCSIFIDKFLGGVLIIDIIKAVALPDT